MHTFGYRFWFHKMPFIVFEDATIWLTIFTAHLYRKKMYLVGTCVKQCRKCNRKMCSVVIVCVCDWCVKWSESLNIAEFEQNLYTISKLVSVPWPVPVPVFVYCFMVHYKTRTIAHCIYEATVKTVTQCQ